MLTTKYDERIAELGTDRQRECYEAFCRIGSQKGTAAEIGVSRPAVSKNLKALAKKATKHGYLQACDEEGVAGVGRHIGKETTHIKDGVVVQRWIRTDNNKEEADRYIRDMVEALSEEIKGKSEIVPAPRYTTDKLLSLYGFFDRHVAMLAWGKETGGDDYDLKLATELETSVIQRLVASQPTSKTALLVFGGDFFHADDDNQVTPAHKNKLDVDGRASKVFKTGVMIAINAILTALKKHEKVRVEVVPGNHDPVSSDHLMYVLWAYFNNNDRVEVAETHGPFAYYRFGRTLLAFHHGDKAKPRDLYTVISTDRRSEWSEVEWVDAYSGHFHGEAVDDIGIVRFETLATPIPADAHSASRWRSRRCAHAITYDLEEGEIGRTKQNITPKREN